MNKLTKSILASAVLAFSLSGCSVRTLDMNHLGQALEIGTEALSLTNDQIIGYVQQSVAQMDAQNKVAPANSPYTQRLNRLVGGLTNVGDIPLNFKVYLTNDVNAFACADGSVRVYSGIMDLMTDDELLGIIGHEIGHVGMEHSKNAFKQQLMNQAFREALASTNSTVAALTQSQLSQLADSYVSAKFSRKQENEADEFGYEFLKGAGRNPYVMVDAFEKMENLEGQKTGSAGSYFQKAFSSHPETAERIEHIKALCKRDGFKPM